MSEMRNSRTVHLVLSGVCAAIVAVLAQISIPMPAGVPISLQTFAVALCGYVLGWKYGLLSIAGYLLLGAIGVPVFTGLKGGGGILFGPTGGFLVGFLSLVVFCGLEIRAGSKEVTYIADQGKKWKKWKKSMIRIGLGAFGLLLCHLIGILWFMYVSSNTLGAALVAVSIPFLPKDILCIVGAYFLAGIIKKTLHAGNIGLS